MSCPSWPWPWPWCRSCPMPCPPARSLLHLKTVAGCSPSPPSSFHHHLLHSISPSFPPPSSPSCHVAGSHPSQEPSQRGGSPSSLPCQAPAPRSWSPPSCSSSTPPTPCPPPSTMAPSILPPRWCILDSAPFNNDHNYFHPNIQHHDYLDYILNMITSLPPVNATLTLPSNQFFGDQPKRHIFINFKET